MAKKTKAVVLGVGARTSAWAPAASRRFAKEGYHVLVAGRTGPKIDKVVQGIRAAGGSATAIVVDGTREDEVVALFDKAMADDAEGAPADLLVFNMGNNARRRFPRDDGAGISRTRGGSAALPASCLAGKPCAAWRRSVAARSSSPGASGSLRGRPRFAAFNATKGGLRLMVQSMAREFGPQGIHVAHAIIDGGIEGERLLSRMPDRVEKAGPDGLLNLDAIADSYWHLHRQHRSAWTHEIDLRPYKEPF